MTLVLNGKGLLLEGSNPKIEDKQVPGIYKLVCSPFSEKMASKGRDSQPSPTKNVNSKILMLTDCNTSGPGVTLIQKSLKDQFIKWLLQLDDEPNLNSSKLGRNPNM